MFDIANIYILDSGTLELVKQLYSVLPTVANYW